MPNKKGALFRIVLPTVIFTFVAACLGWNYFDYQYNDGDYYYRKQQYAKAISGLAASLETAQHKDDANCLKRLAACYRLTRQPDVALSFLDRASEANKTKPQLFAWTVSPSIAHSIEVERGWTYYDKRDYENALAAFKKAAAERKTVDTTDGIASVYEAQGKFSEAEKMLTEAISDATGCKTETAYHERAIFYRNIGDLEKYVADLKSAVKSESCPSAFFELGSYYREQKNWKDAEYWLTKAIGCDTNQENYYHSRALVLEKLGDYHRAISDMDTALKIDPSCPDAATDKERMQHLLVQTPR